MSSRERSCKLSRNSYNNIIITPSVDIRGVGDYYNTINPDAGNESERKETPGHVDFDLYASPGDPLQRGLPTLARRFMSDGRSPRPPVFGQGAFSLSPTVIRFAKRPVIGL